MAPAEIQLWEQVLATVNGQPASGEMPPWLGELEPLALAGSELSLGVPSQEYLNRLSSQLRQELESIAGRVFGQPMRLSFKLHPATPVAGRGSLVPAAVRAFVPVGPEVEVSLNSAYTFDNFIVGPSNRLAHAGCLAVVEAPGQAYNPLFIHSGVGLGKSHLLQATCLSILRTRPTANILYLSCEQFVNHFIQAVQQGNIERFHHRYRHLDTLVIDDIHFLADKERTQEEFFHTFNTLYQSGKQVILSSDSRPHEIPRLEERLVSRFKWGLVCTIDRPSFETRVAIVQKKAQMRGRELPGDVVRYIATHIDTNIRELEGAIVRLLGYAALCNRPLDIDIAQEALKDIVLTAQTTPSIQDIVEAVCRRYNVRLSDLQGKRRNQTTTLPRQICMFMARQLTNHSLQEIGTYFGGRDHTTVLHAQRKIARLISSDTTLRGVIDAIRQELA